MLKDCDVVKINCDLSDKVLKGAIGAVVMVYEDPYLAYEVEFLDEEGWTIGLFTVKPEQIDLLDSGHHSAP